MATPGPQGLQDHIFLFLLFDDVILFSSEIDLSLMALFTQPPSSTVLYSLPCRVVRGRGGEGDGGEHEGLWAAASGDFKASQLFALEHE